MIFPTQKKVQSKVQFSLLRCGRFPADDDDEEVPTVKRQHKITKLKTDKIAGQIQVRTLLYVTQLVTQTQRNVLEML